MTDATPHYIDHVIDGVYIGGARALRELDTIRALGLRHVLKLYDWEPYWPSDFVVLENPVNDGELLPPGTLQRGVDFVRQHVKGGKLVLVQCGAGISRSATFVLGYLLSEGHDLRQAFLLLRGQHPSSWPHPALWQSLLSHFPSPYTLDDTIRWLHSDAVWGQAG